MILLNISLARILNGTGGGMFRYVSEEQRLDVWYLGVFSWRSCAAPPPCRLVTPAWARILRRALPFATDHRRPLRATVLSVLVLCPRRDPLLFLPGCFLPFCMADNVVASRDGHARRRANQNSNTALIGTGRQEATLRALSRHRPSTSATVVLLYCC
jgi:hypothetical protein